MFTSSLIKARNILKLNKLLPLSAKSGHFKNNDLLDFVYKLA